MSALTVHDRDVVQRALARYGPQERTLVAALVVEKPRRSPAREKRVRKSAPLAAHCVYCGWASRAGACAAHADLPALDPSFLTVIHRTAA